MVKIKAKTVTEYLKAIPAEAKANVKALREILKSVAPEAKETIKRGTPVFEDERILFSYSAFKAHINFMPTRTSLEPFKGELSKYVTGKDTIQFPHDKPLPKALIKKIAAYRVKDVKENGALWMTS